MMVFDKLKKPNQTPQVCRAATRPALPSPPRSQRHRDSPASPCLALGTQHLRHSRRQPGGLQGTAFGNGDQQTATAESRKPHFFGKPANNGSLLFGGFFYLPTIPSQPAAPGGKEPAPAEGHGCPCRVGTGTGCSPIFSPAPGSRSLFTGSGHTPGLVMNDANLMPGCTGDNRDHEVTIAGSGFGYLAATKPRPFGCMQQSKMEPTKIRVSIKPASGRSASATLGDQGMKPSPFGDG